MAVLAAAQLVLPLRPAKGSHIGSPSRHGWNGSKPGKRLRSCSRNMAPHWTGGTLTLLEVCSPWMPFMAQAPRRRRAVPRSSRNCNRPSPANPSHLPGPDFHLYFDASIHVDGDHATAHSMGAYLIPDERSSGGWRLIFLVSYDDILVRQNGHWLFKQRLLHPAATSAKVNASDRSLTSTCNQVAVPTHAFPDNPVPALGC